MKSARFSTSTIARLLWVLPVFAAHSCGQTTSGSMMSETVVAGREYVQYLEIPTPFHRSAAPARAFQGPWDVHEFRQPGNGPDSWAVGSRPALRHEPGSDNAFGIPTGATIPQKDWAEANTIEEFKVQRGGRYDSQRSGADFEFEGHRYPVRGSGTCGLVALKGNLVMVICSQGGRGETTGKTIDFFDGRSGQRLAALDLKYARPDYIGLMDEHIHFLSSRWTAIALDTDLRKLLLFDFDSAFQ